MVTSGVDGDAPSDVCVSRCVPNRVMNSAMAQARTRLIVPLQTSLERAVLPRRESRSSICDTGGSGPRARGSVMLGILYTVAVILLVLWIIGLLVHVASAAIHLLLVAAVIIVLWNLISGRRSTV